MPEIDTYVNGVSHKDLTIQQKEDIKRRLNMVDETPVDFEDLFAFEAWPKGQPSITYRTLLPYQLDAKDIPSFKLLEYTAPQQLKLEYASFTTGVKNYATFINYSWQDVEGNADSVVGDSTTTLKAWNRQLRTAVYGEALLATRNYLADVTTGTNKIIEAFDLAQIAFRKMHIRPIDGGNWRAYMPIELVKPFKGEYVNAYGSILPEPKGDEVLKGCVAAFDSFNIVNPVGYGADSLVKLTDAGETDGYYIVFVGKTETGVQPGKRNGDGQTDADIIVNPLGSGIVQDAEGHVVGDANHQKGSIAMNVKYFDAHIIDDRCVLKVFVKASYLTDMDYSTAFANVTGNLGEVIKGKTGYKGAYWETHEEVEGKHEVSPIAFVDGQTTEITGTAAITLALTGEVSQVFSTDTTKATVVIDEDPTKVKVTGKNVAGSATIVALDKTGVNAAQITVTTKTGA